MLQKSLLGVAVLLLAACAASMADDAKDPGAGDLKKLQGTWRFVAQEMDGKPRPKEEVAKLTITFSGDKWTVREGDKVHQGGTHKLNPTKKPAEVDAVVTEGEGKGSKMLGIYELRGDAMKVCFDPQGKARPTSLTSKEGQFAATIHREKKK